MRRIQWRLLFVLVAFVMNNRGFSAYEKQADSVFFVIKKQKDTDAQWMKIQVCSEGIIRVVAAPEKSFSTRASLMVEKSKWKPVPCSVKEKSGQVEISTSKLTIRVRLKTGAVAFYDAKGTLLLQEKTDSGKIITPAEVMGEQTFHIQQIFDSPADEAFYGLGAHQNAIMNYKGHEVDLWQHNIVDVIPFLVSSKNYGILWDNYSRTKFGDIREYQPLSSLTLYDKEGIKGGLTVEYFNDRSFGSPLVSQTETKIEHDFVDAPGTFPEGFDRNRGSVRWSGELQSDQTGVHKFRLYSSGYMKMWLNGELVVDEWRQNWLPWTNLPQLNMEAGKRYPIKIEWIPTGGNIGLKYLTPEDKIYENSLSLYSEVADQIDYYFVYGENLDEVIQGYREITGKAPMMPKWSMGFWQCRQRYTSQDELLSVVKEFRKRQIPLDNIVQDWFYWKEDQWGSHEFDPTRFPDPDGMVKELHDNLHTRIMISVWPKFYVGTKHYEEFKAKGWLYMHNVEIGRRDWVGPGYVSTFFDPFSEGARNLYWQHIRENIFCKGFDAWWVDATEPDLQSNVSDSERLLRMHPNALGTAARYENAFSLVMTKGIYENQRKSNLNQRVFILTRSAYAGQQRYAAATWSGDLAARWHDLKAQIPAGLNFSLSGIPYWGTDIGGFAVESRYQRPNDSDLDEWRELNTRWFQFGAFCPLFRSHGEFPYREMFNIAPENHPAYQTMLAYDKLRYRLMPYIYSLTGMVTQNDYTIMRALVMDFGQDKNVLNVGDQYMFGPALLVNPVTEYKARTRQVYLPTGSGWYDLKSGQHYKGGQTIQADAPYADIPLFVKAGSILPCGPEIQYTDEKAADPIRLFVYTGGDGSFTLYEDENINYNYEQGHFAIIPLSYSEKNRTLTIGMRQGEFAGMLATRTFEIVWIGAQKSSGLDFQAKPAVTVTYDGTQQSVKME
jgi:alpha-D-xyloside xylohydrolase